MSFISVEPQSRVLLESHSDSLLAQFDTQRRIIASRYLAFFQERRTIEATYIESLRKLHRKATTADDSFDPRVEPTTTRSAWDKVRENLERDASTRQNFVDVLDNYVIGPLAKLKETEDETRKRVEEALRASTAECADHAENTISKFQLAYLKKYHPRHYAHSIDISQRPQDSPDKWLGGKVSSLFRGLREPAKSEEVSDDDFRMAVSQLNTFRSTRAEDLGDGYDCLEQLVFTPTVKDVFVKYMDGMIAAYTKHENLAKTTKVEIKKTLGGTDTSDLRASLRRALSFSVPPPTLYCNYHPGVYSGLIFGVSIIDVTTNRDNAPKAMRLCIDEVEKRGMNTKRIYSLGSVCDAEVLQLRRRIESDKTFSFDSTDNIHFVAMLLRRYLWDLPEPLLVLSLQDYSKYRQNRARYIKNDFSLLRSKIHELHPIQRASLRALLQHLFRVASHSDKNAMTVEALAAHFRYAIFRGNAIVQDGVHVKGLVLEDLIQNAHTLFDERPSPSFHVPSPDVKETTSTHTYGSLFLSPELPQLAEFPTVGSTIGRGHGLVVGFPTSPQSSFSSLPSDAVMDIHRSPSPTLFLNARRDLGLASSKTLTEGVETMMREEAITEVRDAETGETSTTTPVEGVSGPSTSVDEWLLRQSRLPPPPEALTIPQSPPESVLPSASDFSLSSATSLQTGMGRFAP